MTDERQESLIGLGDEGEHTARAEVQAESGQTPVAGGDTRRPRVRRIRRVDDGAGAAASLPPQREAPIPGIGHVPRSADAWGIRKRIGRGPKDWEPQRWAPPGERVAASLWPLDTLSSEVVADRWGAGEYEIEWCAVAGIGGRRFICRSKPFTVIAAPVDVEPPPPAVALAPPQAPILSPDLQQAFALVGFLEQQTTSKLAQLAQLGQAFGGGQQNTVMMAMIQQQNAMFERMMAQQQQQHAALLRELREGGDGDGAGDALAEVASAAASAALDPDAGFWDVAKQMVAKDPVGVLGKVKEIAETLPGLVGAYKEMTKPAAPPAPPPSPHPAPRRIVSRDTSTPTHTANGAAPAKPAEAIVTGVNMPPPPANA